jgi:hypothetical protein
MKRILFVIAITAFLASCNSPSTETKKEETPVVAETKPAETKVMPAEIGDPKYIDMGKKQFEYLSSGDIENWSSSFADNAVYIWNNGDSLVGKKAIHDYWVERRGKMIDSLTFQNQIWLPVKVNQPQSIEAPGLWLMSWSLVHAKYKNGKSMSQWMHNTIHYNSEDKIDRLLNFRDNALILAAMKK